MVPETSSGTYVISVVFLSVILSVCLSVRNADISETIIARAAKFGMLNLSKGFLKDAFVLEISNFKDFRCTRYFRRRIIDCTTSSTQPTSRARYDARFCFNITRHFVLRHRVLGAWCQL